MARCSPDLRVPDFLLITAAKWAGCLARVSQESYTLGCLFGLLDRKLSGCRCTGILEAMEQLLALWQFHKDRAFPVPQATQSLQVEQGHVLISRINSTD